jgi:hypothetical protein
MKERMNIFGNYMQEQTRGLKQYFQDHSHEKPTPEDWYNSLPAKERKNIYRTGAQESTEYFNDGEHLE